MRHADRPELEVSIMVAAPPDAVWPLVCDITTPVAASDELRSVTWTSAGPGLGATFVGTNRNQFLGEWETTATVTQYDPPHTFAWLVGDPDDPNTTWRFTLVPDGAGTLVTQWAKLGTGPSGLHLAISANPGKEERIVARRLEQWRAAMTRTLESIKARAEG